MIEVKHWNNRSNSWNSAGRSKEDEIALGVGMFDIFAEFGKVKDGSPESVKSHYMLLEQKASECVGCKQCEERSPFGVAIADRMSKAAELFEKCILSVC